MFRILAALFLLLASAAAASAQGLSPSVWQSQRGTFPQWAGRRLLHAICQIGSSCGLWRHANSR